jgi:hypothetical protein
MVDNPDVTFTQCSAAVWSLLEMNLGILCNSLAALKPFVRRHMPNFFSKTGSNNYDANASSSYAKGSKASKGGRGWGHSYQLHSVGKGETEQQAAAAAAAGAGKGDMGGGVFVVDQYSVDYDSRTKASTMTPGKGSSTESILPPHYPAHQPV